MAQPAVEGLPTEEVGVSEPLPQTQAQPKKVHPELVNLAEEMMKTDEGKKELEKLARTVIDEYDSDQQSRSEWDKIREFYARLYYQTDYPVSSQTSDDRAWGATESMPLLTEAVNQFVARGRKTLFPNRNFVSVLPVSLGTVDGQMTPEQAMAAAKDLLKGLKERAEKLAKHMNFQLIVESTGYKRGKTAALLSVAVHGSHFTKTYWNVAKDVPQVDNVRAVDLVVPYNVGPKAIEDVPRKTHRIWTDTLATEMLKRQGFYCCAAEPLDNVSEHLSDVDKAAAAEEGLEVDENQGDDENGAQICLILEQHRYWEIEDPADKTTKLIVPVIVWVDKASEKVMRFTIRYRTDETGQPLDNRNPVEYFTHYKFFENADGFYGFGLGHMIGNLNAASNIMLRQMMDAATLANDGNMSGFISQRLCPPDGEDVSCDLGKLKPIPDNVGNIKDGIYMMQFPGPNAALGELMNGLVSSAQRLGGATEAVTGQVDKVRQPMALATELEQSLELPSSVMTQLADCISDELMKIFRLNSLYLQDKVVFAMDDEVEVVSREDYTEDLRVQPMFDAMQATTAQKVAMAQAELQAVMQNPNSQTRPEVIDIAFRRYMEAIGIEDVNELVPEPPAPLRIDDQNAENALFLMPQHPPIDVFADQNHAQHLQMLESFMATPFGKELTPQAAQELLAHRQKHMAYLYANEVGVNVDGQNAGGGAQTAAPAMGIEGGGQGMFDAVAPALPGLAGGPAGANMGAPAPAGGPAAGIG